MKSYCSSCGRLFGGQTGFDKHRKNFTCIDPMSMKGQFKEIPAQIPGWLKRRQEARGEPIPKTMFILEGPAFLDV